MKLGQRIVLITAITLLPFTSVTVRAEDAPTFKDDKEKASYAIGLFFGNQIKSGSLEVDTDVIMSAIKDVQAGRDLKLTQQQAREAIMAYQTAAKSKAAEKNRAEGEAFLAANKVKDGILTMPVALAEGGSAELQYKVITIGSGNPPTRADTVKVNYRGTLINGTEFDSNAKHGGQPAQFPVTGVIKGWTEALLKMPVGSKWQLFIPSSLAYGDRGNQNIEPGSTLIFEVELLEAQAPTPPPEAKPLTSDIIRVPSADEMKAGAKIEVIKATDLEKTNAASSSK